MARYQSGSLQIHTTDLNAGAVINIGGVTQMQIGTGTESAADDAGDIYDNTRSIVSQMPEATLTLKSIASVLDYIGLAGYCISSDGSHPGVRLFTRVLNDCKNPPLSTDNLRYTIGEGLVILGQISASRGQDATITLLVHAITDGTNAPLSGTYGGITLPTGLATQQFVLGHCKVGNVVLSDLESMQLNFGVQISNKTPEMGSVWPDSIAVRKVQPVATFTGFNPTILDAASIPLGGKQATHAQTLIQLKKRQNYSTFVADGTGEHIAVTMNGLASITDAVDAAGNAEATCTLRVEGVHDGTNVPITYVTNSTYDPTP